MLKKIFILLFIVYYSNGFSQNITRVYNDYYEFSKRTNRSENGVDKTFAHFNPDFANDNKTNKGCFNCLRTVNSDGSSSCTDCDNVHLCIGMNKCKFSYLSMECANCSSVTACLYLQNETGLDGTYFTCPKGGVCRMCKECDECVKDCDTCDNCDDCIIDCQYHWFEIYDCKY